MRQRLAAKAFAHTAQYDAMVSAYFTGAIGAESTTFPADLNLSFRKHFDLRYGENPHQRAAFYDDARAIGASVARAGQLQGKELSYNNIADSDTALECVRQFDSPACVIVKHANPCGVAVAGSAAAAYELRLSHRSDFRIRRHHRLQSRAHRRQPPGLILERQFVEVILAPAVSDEAKSLLAAKSEVRVLETGDLRIPVSQLFEYRSVTGGLLVQTRDSASVRPQDLRVVTKRAPTEDEREDLLFAWRVAKYVKSNAIVCAKDKATIGIGAGQMSRVVSSKIAALKARDEGLSLQGASAASDAFFPFRDGLDVVAELGIKSVIQPGGSKRDAEVIAAADEHGIAMMFTGIAPLSPLASAKRHESDDRGRRRSGARTRLEVRAVRAGRARVRRAGQRGHGARAEGAQHRYRGRGHRGTAQVRRARARRSHHRWSRGATRRRHRRSIRRRRASAVSGRGAPPRASKDRKPIPRHSCSGTAYPRPATRRSPRPISIQTSYAHSGCPSW